MIIYRLRLGYRYCFFYLTTMGYTPVRKFIHIENRNRFNLIHEKEWTCMALGPHRSSSSF